MADAPAERARLIDGKYELVRKLGEGGMGAVFEAVHRRLGRRVAIKFLLPALASEPDVLARFEREAQAASAIGHPHIAQVTDIGETAEGSAYLVLEYLDGRELSHDLEQGLITIGKACRILRQVCEGLSVVHERGIVHRDLKPSNIFLVSHLNDRDFVKILDFGVAKFTRPEGEQPSLKTRTGVPIGTPAYMSPEQAQGKRDVDHRTDIYAMGAILFQCLIGRAPFEGESYAHLLMQIMLEPAPAPRSFRPDLPEALEAVMMRLLAKKPDDRYQSCAEVSAALEPFIGIEDVPPARAVVSSSPTSEVRPRDRTHLATPTPATAVPVAPTQALPEPPPKARPSRMPVFLGAALVGAVAIAAGAWALWPRPEPIAAPLAPRMRIDIAPIEAELSIDGVRAVNPFDGELVPGSHRIEGRLAGYAPVRLERTLASGDAVHLELQPIPAAPEPPPPEPVAQQPVEPPPVAQEPATLVRRPRPPRPDEPAPIVAPIVAPVVAPIVRPVVEPPATPNVRRPVDPNF